MAGNICGTNEKLKIDDEKKHFLKNFYDSRWQKVSEQM